MKKSVQVYTERSRSGFTLVELLVVVSIIAILSVIGLVIFTGVQRDARDARRRTDIDSIAQAMEVNFGKTTPGQYDALSASFFSQGSVPQDPARTKTICASSRICIYCSVSSAQDCPNTVYTEVAAGAPVAGTSFTVCTNLEAGGRYCRSGQQ